MEHGYAIISFVIGTASVGLGIITIIDESLRMPGMIVLISLIMLLFTTLKVEHVNRQLQAIRATCVRGQEQADAILERFDIHKKIYKIENELKNMRKTGRKGAIDPIWGFAALAIIILIVFILLALGVL